MLSEKSQSGNGYILYYSKLCNIWKIKFRVGEHISGLPGDQVKGGKVSGYNYKKTTGWAPTIVMKIITVLGLFQCVSILACYCMTVSKDTTTGRNWVKCTQILSMLFLTTTRIDN